MDRHDRAGIAGKVFMVTAGASGIGRASAHNIAAGGGHVGIFDVNGEGAAMVADELRAYGVKAIAFTGDVRSRADLEAAADGIEGELGPIHGLAAVAGISRPSPAEEIVRDDWDAVIGISLTGCFNSCQAAGRRMIERKAGVIVTVSSMDGFSAHSGRSSYCAAKYGVIGLTKTLAIEWGRFGIRTNSVAPGITDTPAVKRAIPPEQIENVLLDRTSLGRMGTSDDMGKSVAFLMSDEAAYINGAVLPVDGGLSAGYFTRWQGGDYASNGLLQRGAYTARA
jgi:NAD(P)-dependent dehydrogenase (short-subunit alcohol dehydrogenase family)